LDTRTLSILRYIFDEANKVVNAYVMSYIILGTF
jgi:hypothetical protein